MKDLFL